MSRFSHNFVTASGFALVASVSAADVTADDVWNDWQSYLSALGYSVEGTQSRDGARLIVSDLTVTGADNTEAASGQIKMDQVTFAEQSDGSVDVTLPAVMPMAFSAPNDTGGETQVTMDYRQTGMELSVSGDPADLNYTYTADTVTLETTDIVVNGESMAPNSNGFRVAFDGLAGTMDMALDSKRRYAQALQVDTVSYTMLTDDPATQTSFSMSGTAQNLEFDGTSTMPLRVVQANDMDAMLAAGFEVDGTFTYQENTMDIAAKSPEGPVTGKLTSDNGSLNVAMDQGGISYSALQNGSGFDLTSGQFPFPVRVDMAKSAFNISSPVRQSDQVEDYAMGLTLEGVSMSDMLWSIFDPSAQLPRDPATIAVDLSGKARLLFDFLDPEAAMMADNIEGAPAEIESVDINKVQVAIAGAELTGAGGFTFDNSGSAPKPQGSVDLTLVGGNGLIDKLVAIGLLPEEQAMGARMMMGLLAVPGDAPDTMSSKIEINNQGHISANGQRIK